MYPANTKFMTQNVMANKNLIGKRMDFGLIRSNLKSIQMFKSHDLLYQHVSLKNDKKWFDLPSI